MLTAVALILFAYLFGSVSSAIIVCRVLQLPDPRTNGSNNPGATNVLRLSGKGPAAATLAGDLLKGVVPVLAGHWLGVAAPVLAGTALAAFAGHLFPVFFGFRGGKGVATMIGVLLALAWPVGLAVIVTWLLVAAVFRYSSVAALAGAAMAPVYTGLLAPQPSYIAAVTCIGLILFWRHRSNIRNLLAGRERRIGKKAAG